MAKAQAELVNPEKSLTASVRTGRETASAASAMHRSRAGSTSCATDAKLLNRAQERLVRLWRCAMKPSDLARVVIDTTVQPKAVMSPG